MTGRRHITLTSPMQPEALTALQPYDVVIGPATPDTDAIISLLTDPVRADVFTGSRLKVVAQAAAGFDNIDVAAASAAGVPVTNTPGLLDEATADVAFALILSACRRTTEAEASLRRGEWTGWALDGYLGMDVHGATLALIGYGRIGSAVARRAAGFGMTVLHHTRRDTGEPGWTADLDGMLAQADVVSLHCPLTPETRHILDARRLALLKPSAVVVNTARGPVLDEDALVDALTSGRLFAAGLDVYDGEPRLNPRLLAAPNVTLLPHVGSATGATRLAMVRHAVANAVEVLEGRAPLSPVGV